LSKPDDPISANAIKMVFKRLKKDENWLGNESLTDTDDNIANGNGNGAGASNSAGTPGKRGPKKGKKGASDSDSDGENGASPSKKGPLNKTMGGRVSKF
jgi:hypothetical protein